MVSQDNKGLIKNQINVCGFVIITSAGFSATKSLVRNV